MLNSSRQLKIPEHILNRNRRCYELGIVRQSINKHVSDGINKDRENLKGVQQLRSWVGWCHWEGDSQEPRILAKGNQHREHKQHQDSSHQEDLKVHSFQQTMFMMTKRTPEQITDVSRGNTAAFVGIGQFLLKKIGTLKTVEDAANDVRNVVGKITVNPRTDATAFKVDQSTEKQTDLNIREQDRLRHGRHQAV